MCVCAEQLGADGVRDEGPSRPPGGDTAGGEHCPEVEGPEGGGKGGARHQPISGQAARGQLTRS